jgi:hypothetical protein
MPIALPRWLNAVAFAALAAGCASHRPVDGDPGNTGQPQMDPSPDPVAVPQPTGTPPAPPPAPAPEPKPVPTPQPVCPIAAPGTALFSLDTGGGALDLQSDLAVDAKGNALYVRGSAGSFSLTKYSADGVLVFRAPFGEAVATDAEGNAHVAASFKAPIDIGLGVMVPEGNVDVFIAKLAPDGTPLFARPLRLCGDGVRAIAVAADGRIAVSGAAMGTVVLDAHGEPLFDRAFAGDVAFDSVGNLIVAGGFAGTVDLGGGASFTTAGDLDGFVVKLDRNGNPLWSYRFGDADLPARMLSSGTLISIPTRQLVDAVAVGPHDEVVLVGQFDYDLKLFGTDHVAVIERLATVQLRSGGFSVVLDAAGAVASQSVRIGFDGYADVAVDRAGHAASTGMELAEAAPPFRYARLDVAGEPGGGIVKTNDIGAGHAVAFDPCGNVLWSASISERGAATPMRSLLMKLVP